jgi:hypothetical protein
MNNLKPSNPLFSSLRLGVLARVFPDLTRQAQGTVETILCLYARPSTLKSSAPLLLGLLRTSLLPLNPRPLDPSNPSLLTPYHNG